MELSNRQSQFHYNTCLKMHICSSLINISEKVCAKGKFCTDFHVILLRETLHKCGKPPPWEEYIKCTHPKHFPFSLHCIYNEPHSSSYFFWFQTTPFHHSTRTQKLQTLRCHFHKYTPGLFQSIIFIVVFMY